MNRIDLRETPRAMFEHTSESVRDDVKAFLKKGGKITQASQPPKKQKPVCYVDHGRDNF